IDRLLLNVSGNSTLHDSIQGATSANPATDFMEAYLDLGATVTLFGQRETAFEASGYVQYDNNIVTARAQLTTVGDTVVLGGGFPFDSRPYPFDALKLTTTYWVGPVPIYTSAAIGAVVQLKGTSTNPTQKSSQVSLTPTYRSAVTLKL